MTTNEYGTTQYGNDQYGNPRYAPPDEHQPMRYVAIGARFVGYLVYFYVIVVEIFLFLGFLLLLFGANTSAGFVEWVYRNLDRAMTPFRGIFTPIELGMTGGNEVESVFDTSILFAMMIYAIVGLAAHAAIHWLTVRIRRLERSRHEEQLRYENQLLRDQLARTAQATADPTPVNAPPPPAPPRPPGI